MEEPKKKLGRPKKVIEVKEYDPEYINRPEPGESITDFCNRFFGKYEGQWKFLADKSRYRAAIGGIGSGKSLTSSFDLVKHALEYDESMHMVIAPTYKMLSKATWVSIKKALNWWGPSIEWKENKSEQTITLSNGSKIFSGFAQEPDNLRGVELSTFFIDEAAMCPKEAWDIMIGRIRQPGKPHKGWIATTPRGKNWVWDKFINTEDKNYSYFHWKTSDNPLYSLEPGYLNDLVVSYGGVDSKFYQQEVLGQFVTFEGLIYDMFDKNIHISNYIPENPKSVIAGIDWGITSQGVITVVSIENDIAYVIDEVVRKNTMISFGKDDWVGIAKKLVRDWGVEKFYADPSDPNAIMTMQKHGLPVVQAKNQVIPGIREVQSRFSGGKLKINPGCVNLLGELGSYEWKKDKNDRILFDIEPVKINDHSVDSLRYAIMGTTNNMVSPIFG